MGAPAASVVLDNLTIEHIIPQNQKLSDEWVSSLGNNWKEIQEKYLHTIGNLTLTAYNSEMGDLPFAQKLAKDGGFQESALRLNKYVVQQTSWGEEQIKERATQLGEIAKRAWPYPTIKEAELAPYRKQDYDAPKYTLEDYQSLNAFNHILFEKLNTHILNLGTCIKREFKKSYITYKVNTDFISIVIKNKALRVFVDMGIDKVINPKGIAKNVSDISHEGIGDIEIMMDSLDKLDDVMFIIKQTFKEQESE